MSLSISLLPVHLVGQFPPIPEPPQIFPQHLEAPLSRRLRDAAHMGRDQHIRRLPQRIVRRQRLRIGNIPGRTRNLLGLERLNQRRLVDDLAARDIRDVRPRGIRLVQDGELRPGQEVHGLLAVCISRVSWRLLSMTFETGVALQQPRVTMPVPVSQRAIDRKRPVGPPLQ